MSLSKSRVPSNLLRRRVVPALLAAVLSTLVAAPGVAQKLDVSELHVAVQDMATKKLRAPVKPGELLILSPGEKVRLRMVAVPADSNRAPRYPSTKFSLNSDKREVAISKIDDKEGSAIIEARSVTPGGKGPVLVMFEILADDLAIRPGKMKGTISVRVKEGH